MKITNERFEISPSESVSWGDVKTLRILNDKLALVMKDGSIVELSNLRPNMIDRAFRAYDMYVKEHPEKRQA